MTSASVQQLPGTSPGQQGRPRGGAGIAGIARGALSNLVGSVVSALATFGFSVLVARTASSQEQAGIFFALSSLFLIGQALCRVGLPIGLVYFFARYRTTGEQHLIAPLERYARNVVIGTGIAGGVVGLVLAGPLADLFVGSRGNGAVTLVRLLSCFLVLASLTDLAVGSTRGFGAMRPMVYVDRIGRPVGQVVLAGALAVLGVHSAIGFGLAWALPWLPATVVLMVWSRSLRRRMERHALQRAAGQPAIGQPAIGQPASEQPASDQPSGDQPSGVRADRLQPGQRRAFWRFVGPRSLSSIAQLVLQRADIILIGALRGPRDAAIYTAATRFLVFGQLLSNSIGQVIQTRLAQLMVLDDRAAARKVYQAATVWVLLSSWPVYLLSTVFSTELLTVFGRGYRTGSIVIVVLSLAMLVSTATGTVDTVLNMAGRGSWTMVNAFAALGTDLVLNVLLIPRLGLLGAALAWAAAILINNVVPLVQLTVSLRLHPFGRATSTAAVVCAVCYGAVPLAVRLVAGGGLVAAAAAAVAGTALYLACLYRWRELFELKLPSRAQRVAR